MGKRKTDPLARKSGESHFDWRGRVARAKQAANDRSVAIVTPETEQHGDYRDTFVTDVSDGTKTRTKVNHGGTTLRRWQGKLSITQTAAIDRCIAHWERLETNPHTTASYGERTGGGGNVDDMADRVIDARNALARFQGYVPDEYWQIFENVCRWDMPSSDVGEAMGYSSRGAKDRVFTVVAFVGDIIAMQEGL